MKKATIKQPWKVVLYCLTDKIFGFELWTLIDTKIQNQFARLKSTGLVSVFSKPVLLSLIALILGFDGVGLKSALAAQNVTTDARALPSIENISIQRLSDNRYNLVANSAEYSKVLAELSRIANIQLTLVSSVSGKISIKLIELSLESLLVRLLGENNYIILYKNADGKKNRFNFQNVKSDYVLIATNPEHQLIHNNHSVYEHKSNLHSSNEKLIDKVENWGDIDSTDSVINLEKIRFTGHSELKLSAIDSLADIGTPQSITSLGKYLGDPDSSIREQTIYALSDIGTEQAIHFLTRAIKDKDPNLRNLAISQLSLVKSDQSVDALVFVINNDDVLENCLLAISALGEIASESAIEYLWDIRNGDRLEESLIADEVLGQITLDERIN